MNIHQSNLYFAATIVNELFEIIENADNLHQLKEDCDAVRTRWFESETGNE